MPDDDAKVRRTLHIRFTIPGGDPAPLKAMMQAAAPFYHAFGDMQVRLLHNVDDATRFVQVIDYEIPAEFERSRQQIASDPRVQAYLAGLRTLAPGGVEMEVLQEVGGGQ